MQISDLSNKWIAELGVYEPGRPIEEVARELGFKDSSGFIKLASNENALGPSPKAIDAMRAAAAGMHVYPDGGAFYLRRALSAHLDVDIQNILVGNGSNEMIELLAHVFLGPGTSIVVAEQAFVVYRLVASAFCAETIAVPMKDFTHDLLAMAEACREDTRLLYVSNPNNPTGTMVDADEIDAFMKAVPDHVVVVFDEAYIELLEPDVAPNVLRYISESDRVVVLRTFSKSYGLAGLRLGYAVASRGVIELLGKVRQPFNANAMAQQAAIAALGDTDHLIRTRALVNAGLAFYESYCKDHQLEYVPSVANFILIKVGAGRDVFRRLQREQVVVRPMDGYGLFDYIRITIGTASENEACVKALSVVMA